MLRRRLKSILVFPIVVILVLLLQLRPVASFLLARFPAAAASAGVRLGHPAVLLQRHHRRSFVTMASAESAGADRTILLLSTTEDKASVGLVNALVRRGGWEPTELPALPQGRAWRRPDSRQPLYMWQIDTGFLRSDFLDQQWKAATSQELQGGSKTVAG